MKDIDNIDYRKRFEKANEMGRACRISRSSPSFTLRIDPVIKHPAIDKLNEPGFSLSGHIFSNEKQEIWDLFHKLAEYISKGDVVIRKRK